MEKRLFNKIIKHQMLSYGFEKTGVQDYAQEATDSITKLIVRIPDEEHNFCVGVQFKDFGKEYSDYTGKFSKCCMSYSGVPRPFGVFENPYDSSEDRIVDAVKNVVDSIEVFYKKVVKLFAKNWILGFHPFSVKKRKMIFMLILLCL